MRRRFYTWKGRRYGVGQVCIMPRAYRLGLNRNHSSYAWTLRLYREWGMVALSRM